jgi:transcriptional regulator with XRE-family HTH domain
MNHSRVAQQLIRICRGRRSQLDLSRRLGFAANQIYRWESGLRGIGWGDFVRICHICSKQISESLRKSLGYAQPPSDSKALVSFLLGNISTTDAAQSLGISRQIIGRWRRGETDPELKDMLVLMERFQGRVIQFVQALLPGAKIDEMEDEWKRIERERDLRQKFPMSSLVCALINSQIYRKHSTHKPGIIADWFGISTPEEDSLLGLLVEMGALKWRDSRYETTPHGLELSGNDPLASLRMRHYWSQFAPAMLGRLKEPPSTSLFGWSVLSVSDSAFEQIRDRLREAYSQIVAIANSDVGQKSAVKIVNLQCIDLEEFRESEAKIPN